MIWILVYWVLLVLAIGVGLRGLFWDRAGFRGRAKLRCRKCWYDLSASPGDVEDGAIVCSECGKKHSSRRAMRKTRRSKRWIAVALVLWMGAYGVSVTPKVQKQGWGAAVPRVLIVAALPFLSEEQGTGLDTPFLKLGIRPTKFDKFVLDQLPFEYGLSFFISDSDIYGWFSRRLVFLLARLESDETITDGTTAKGLAYRNLITGLVRSGKVAESQKRWAQGVEYIEFDLDQSFGPDEVVQAHFQMRRLLLNPYRLRMGSSPFTEYRCSTPSSFRMNGIMPAFTSQEEHDAFWIQRFLWDARHDPQRARGRTSWEIKPVLGFGTQVSPGVGEVQVVMDVLENQGQQSEPQSWEKVHRVTRTLQYTIDPDRIITPDSSAALRDQIQSSFQAHLVVEYDSQESAWVPVVKLVKKRGAVEFEDAVMFGGMVSVRLIQTNYDDQHGRSLLDSRNDQSWWRLGWRDDPGRKIIVDRTDDGEDNPVEVVLGAGRKRTFTARHELSSSLPGEVQSQQGLPSGDEKNYKLVVRITPMQGNTRWIHGGLWADRIYDGELEFPLANWTLIELKRYIVNGTVPDHAMP